ncbi:MAG: aromatic ring-hydroxylating dioxygenase subunit alpha [Myxococcales bacterium]|nr:MAG: aromatic ring-hydroxylating dioxygenase subunit alpha [Myxococcales bacterium]
MLVVRGEDGGVRVLSRVCAHRAADIGAGRGNAKTFRCPYHSWTYRNDGTLTGAPLMSDVEGCHKRDYPLPHIRNEIWEGWIFVNFDEDGEPLAPRMAPDSEMLAEYGVGDLVAVEIDTYDSPFNWKVLVENFMESYHHIAIHRYTLEPIWPGDAAYVPDNTDPWSLLAMPGNGTGLAGGLPATGERFQDWQKTALIAGVVWPTHLFAPSSDATAWYHILPHSYDRFTLRIYACYPRATLEDPKLAEKVAGRGELVKIVHAQDIHACELAWAGLTSGLARPRRLHRLERSIWQQNRWWLDRMEGAIGQRAAHRA